MAKRSETGKGCVCRILVMGPAREWADEVTGAYNQTTICGPTLGEDYAECGWPISLKVKPNVSQKDLVQSLKDLIASIEEYGFELASSESPDSSHIEIKNNVISFPKVVYQGPTGGPEGTL